METIHGAPDPREASAQLDAIAQAERQVRDRPWPLWLYPSNAVLLGGLALVGLLESSMLVAIVTVVIAVGFVALNYVAGQRIGTPFAIPSSRGFRTLVAVSAACVIASLAARIGGWDAAIIGCAVAAVVSYVAASVLHYRATRR